jgi:hypothetical protein
MQRIFISLVLIAFLACFVRAEKANSLEQAKALSAKTGKPLLLDFMTEW